MNPSKVDMPRSFVVEAASSKILVHTRAEGLLARFAHDLELSCSNIEGRASLEGDAWTAELSARVAAIKVEGVLKGTALDRSVLADNDRAEIERKIQREVLSASPVLEARAKGASRTSGDATITLGQASERVRLTQSVDEAEEGALRVSGRFKLLLSALDIKPIKGPMGAFRVKDGVELCYELKLIPEAHS